MSGSMPSRGGWAPPALVLQWAWGMHASASYSRTKGEFTGGVVTDVGLVARSQGYDWCMTAKEKLLQEAQGWSEREAEIALAAVERADGGEPEVAPLPQGFGETLTGEPMPNVVAAVRRSRDDH